MKKNVQIDLITTVATPYRNHMFNKLYDTFSDAGYKFRVNFLFKNDPRRPAFCVGQTGVRYTCRFWNSIKWKRNEAVSFHFGLFLYILKTKPDILIIGGPWATITNAVITMIAKRVCRTTVCWFELNKDRLNDYSSLNRFFKAQLLKKFDLFALPGKDAVNATIELKNDTKIKYVYLPNLIDESMFCQSEKAEKNVLKQILGLNSDTLIALFPARLSIEKNHQRFLNVFKTVECRGWHLVLLGNGPLLESVTEMIGTQNNIHLLQPVPYEEMPKYYRASDLFILPSKWDHNPLTVVEALWSSLPIIISNSVGNYYEAYSPENGWDLNPDNDESIRNALKDAFSTSRETLKLMGKKSFSKAQSFWSTTETVGNFARKLIDYNTIK